MISYRAMLGYDKPGCEHVTDNAIIIKLEILSPLSVVADLRLNLFVRVIVTMPAQLLHALAAAAAKNPRSWIAAILDNLDRLARVSDKLKDYMGGKGC